MFNPFSADFWTGGSATQGLDPNGQYGNYLGGYLQNQLKNNQGPQFNWSGYNQAQGQMQGLANQLQGVASGQQQGAGELAVNRQVNQATAAQQAAARMARGANAALAMRDAARNTAGLGVAGAGQAAQAQMQDQANARNALSGVLGNMQSGALQQQQLGLGGYQAQNQALQAYLQQLGLLNQQGYANQAGINQMNAQDNGALGSLIGGGATLLGQLALQKSKNNQQGGGGGY